VDVERLIDDDHSARSIWETGAFSQVGIGLAIGIPAAIGAGKLMTQQLFSVRPWDPVMLASATLALALAALLASALPAWRAAGVEPMVALSNE
jgi:putative ABC transport system permease protein